MDSAILISLMLLLVFILVTLKNLFSSAKSAGGEKKKTPAPSQSVATASPVAETAVKDAEQPEPSIEFDGEYSAVNEDGTWAIMTDEDEYEPYNDIEEEAAPEPVLSGPDMFDRDFWFNWDHAASSENSEEKIKEYSRILAENGFISEAQAEEIANRSIAYTKQAVKDAERIHSGIFNEEYTFPKEPEKIYIEY